MRRKKFSKSLTIALPMQHFEKIKQITDDEQISLAEWIREAVAAALNNIKREEEQMNESTEHD